jgi:hypothetical protein
VGRWLDTAEDGDGWPVEETSPQEGGGAAPLGALEEKGEAANESKPEQTTKKQVQITAPEETVQESYFPLGGKDSRSRPIFDRVTENPHHTGDPPFDFGAEGEWPEAPVLTHPANGLLRGVKDAQGNQALPVRAYILLRAPPVSEGGAPIGIYIGTWDQFRQLLPGKAYPARGVNLKGESSIEAAHQVWNDKFSPFPRACPIRDLTGSGFSYVDLQ